MTSFLDTVATDLHQRYGNQLSDCCLVFPNRRGRLFFAQSLSKLIDKPLWQPTYSSIEEVVAEWAGRQASDTFALLLELYEVYSEVLQRQESFDRFYFWGEVLLHDFDLIDKYLIDAGHLFQNLKSQKELEGDLSFLTEEQVAYIRTFWNSFSPEESLLQQHFLTIWEALGPIYNGFKQRLKARNMAYEGMLYREVASAPPAGQLKYKQFIFIGFNALNACEKELFRQLRQAGMAEFYWDYDQYYLNDALQEAGMFLRKNMQDFPSSLPYEHFNNFRQEKEIRTVAASSDAIQAKLLPELLKEMKAPTQQSTAVVLADEQLLIPVLHALPAAAEEINVTMGYPLRQTPVYALIELLLQLHRNAKTGDRFYYRDVLAILYHPYIKAMAGHQAAVIAGDIIRKNKVYLPAGAFNGNPLLNTIFRPTANPAALHRLLTGVLAQLSAAGWADNDKMVRGYVLHCHRLLNKLQKAIDERRIELSLPVYTSMLRQLFTHESIPFTGEPLSGLQVLGLLETRNLDFGHVILLSANEGILPRSMNAPSFIPYNLRRGFGLPAVEQHEAVYAYYFYRLLQRAEKITLVYNTKTDEARSGEASRYLMQLKMESGHRLSHSSVGFRIDPKDPVPITVQKDEAVMAILQEYLTDNEDTPTDKLQRSIPDVPLKSISPSALNAYLACSLRFYFRYVALLKVPDEMAEDIDGQLLGNVLHHSMEDLYSAYRGQVVTADSLQSLSEDSGKISLAVERALAKDYYHKDSFPDEASDDGKILLLRDIVLKYVKQVIRYDKTQAPFTLEGTELQFEHRVPVQAGGEKRSVKVGGIIDRMDRRGDHLYIVDYKTGGVTDSFKGVGALFGKDAAGHNAAALQVMLYSVLQQQKEPAKKVTPKLYFMRKLYGNDNNFLLLDKSAKAPVTAISPYSESFTAALSELLSELFNPAVDFTQTSEKESCKYCDYKKICGR